jgi:Fe-S-cluster containining protein
MGLVETVAKMPADRRGVIEDRFEQAVGKLEEAGLLDRTAPRGRRRIIGMEPGKTAESGRAASARYFAQQIACPFLEDESCSIYADRPLMCREYNVTSERGLCRDFRNPGIRKVLLPLYSGGPLVRVAAQVAELEFTALPLTLALEWAKENGESMSVKRDGGMLYETWLASMGASQEGPLGPQ